MDTNMGHNTDELVREALSAGFSHAGELSLDALVFMPEVREMCSADRCNQYGKNWRCPPACGSLEAAAEQAKRYSYGLIVQTVGMMDDDFDYESIEKTMGEHNTNFASLVKSLNGRYEDILPMGAGTCKLCEVCAYPDAPCRYPEDSISSMEAYGLWVSKVCELSGIPYYYGQRSICFSSCYLLI